ncbi:AraC family transcriptional regulator [Paenibacillus oleatilyticus]|uniref:AraC family transcriptional regulator n=1 Tax=Paenibacillus oleatilyticus TaxID=2594886 RepID=UPI001C1FA1EB|nr:helix-turn-helix domain-containing protein [Paenibacillus oleatilyticus]MBU7320633.1 helix-turn-helix domain-containing protein [Paenibacillus oleatilyticus]
MESYLMFEPTQGTRTPDHYAEHKPCSALKAHISCYWSSRTDGTGRRSEPAVTVVPDGCTDLIFEWEAAGGGDVSIRYCGAFELPFSPGPKREGASETFAVRFFPGGAYPFIGVPLGEFKNALFRGTDVWGKAVAELGEQLRLAAGTPERIILVETALLRLLAAADNGRAEAPPALHEAMVRIFAARGTVSVQQLVRSGNISARQLQRLFDGRIGLGPKTFCGIVRFQNILRDAERHPKLSWQEIAGAYGYCDQAHFIRDFKRFYGELPSSLMTS